MKSAQLASRVYIMSKFIHICILAIGIGVFLIERSSGVLPRTHLLYAQAFSDGVWRGLAGDLAVVTYHPLRKGRHVYYYQIPRYLVAKPGHGHGYGSSYGHGHSYGHGNSYGHGHSYGHGYRQSYHRGGYSYGYPAVGVEYAHGYSHY